MLSLTSRHYRPYEATLALPGHWWRTTSASAACMRESTRSRKASSARSIGCANRLPSPSAMDVFGALFARPIGEKNVATRTLDESGVVW